MAKPCLRRIWIIFFPFPKTSAEGQEGKKRKKSKTKVKSALMEDKWMKQIPFSSPSQFFIELMLSTVVVEVNLQYS